MGGGLMQLVAYGAQDIYLTGNPQITFFKVVYRRHTNFSMESIQQTFNGNATFGGDATATISRNGDLVYRMYLEHDVDITCEAGAHTYINICSNYGSNLIKECELEIGGQRIDRQYGHWHSVYSQLTEFNPSGVHSNGLPDGVPAGDIASSAVHKSTLFNTMSGNGGPVSTGINNEDDVTGVSLGSWTITAYDEAGGSDNAKARIFVPLYFWFCRNPGLALPLIALQYHEVKVKMTFDDEINLFHQAIESAGSPDDLLGSSTETMTTTKITGGAGTSAVTSSFHLWCDYIYLDTDERRRFAQVSHEYLIEQLQFQSYSSATTLDLNFNHPVKELIWTDSPTSTTTFVAVGSAASQTTALTKTAMLKREPSTMSGNFQLKLNGHDRFKERDTGYFTRTQVWEHHTGFGSTIKSDAIAVYSFSLKPEEHQPSGTCNFSRIDNAQLTASSGDYYVYAVNYNVLRIMSGMGGLAYSN
tara:strand:+ start:930 stop:2348 length:1419 start_codon:yes stop_codon:yes gene_type:complete